MKKRVILPSVFAALFMLQLISAVTCNLNVNLINQDPYPAIPGDYVDVVFQITGVDNPDCGYVTFEVKQEFPFSLDPGVENPVAIRSGTYDRKYSSFYIAPYKLRVDNNALDGNNPIEVEYYSSKSGGVANLKEFKINIDDSRADFEIFVKDYNEKTGILSLEILNIGKNDVEALTIEIPKQEHIEVKGSNRNIVGDLDSNEYTTAEFEVSPGGGGNIDMNVYYTDIIDVRRSLAKTIVFDPEYFDGRASQKSSAWIYLIILIILAAVGWWIYRIRKRRKRKLLL